VCAQGTFLLYYLFLSRGLVRGQLHGTALQELVGRSPCVGSCHVARGQTISVDNKNAHNLTLHVVSSLSLPCQFGCVFRVYVLLYSSAIPSAKLAVSFLLPFLPLPMAVFLEFHLRLFSSTPKKIRPVWPRFFCTCHCGHAKHGCVFRVLPLCCSSLLPLKKSQPKRPLFFVS
jgi:hypothetical protein